MSQTIQQIASKDLWVLVSQLKENADSAELERVVPQVLGLIDDWTKKWQIHLVWTV
jgi:hypothetical protein